MRLDSVTSGQISEVVNTADTASKLVVGDVFRARIIEITSSEFVLRLSNGSELRAAVEGSIEAFKGQILELMVQSTENGRIVLKNLDLQEQAQAITTPKSGIEAELKTIGMPITQENILIASELKHNLYPLTKNIIEKAADALMTFKQLTIDKAAFIGGNNLSADGTNLKLIDLVASNSLKLGNDISNLVLDIKKLSLSESKLITANGNKAGNTETGPSQPSSEGQAFIKSLAALTSQIKPNLNQKNNLTINDSTLSKQQNNNINSSNGFTEVGSRPNDLNLSNSLVTKTNQESIKSPLQPAADVLEKLFIKLEDISSFNKALFTNEKKLQDSENIKLTSPTETKPESSISTRTTDNLKDSMDKLNIARQIIVASNHPQAEQLLARIDNLQSTVKFISEINSYNTYMQIPLDIKGFKTTGELFVLKRDNKKRKINPEDTSVFITLDTSNIGRFESFINLKKKNININIGLESPEIIEFMKQNSKDLYEILQEKGYRLADIRYRLVSESTNLLNIHKNAAKIMPSKSGIDLKI